MRERTWGFGAELGEGGSLIQQAQMGTGSCPRKETAETGRFLANRRSSQGSAC